MDSADQVVLPRAWHCILLSIDIEHNDFQRPLIHQVVPFARASLVRPAIWSAADLTN